MTTIEPEHADALEGRVDDDRADDVADDQHLEAEEDHPPEVPPERRVRRRASPLPRRPRTAKATSPPTTMIATPTASIDPDEVD